MSFNRLLLEFSIVLSAFDFLNSEMNQLLVFLHKIQLLFLYAFLKIFANNFWKIFQRLFFSFLLAFFLPFYPFLLLFLFFLPLNRRKKKYFNGLFFFWVDFFLILILKVMATHAIICKRYIFYVVSIVDICIKQQIVLCYETNLACTWTSNVLI